ncbi:hypothetical protein GQ473_04470 [archaeon]|nr:hypothetical protein [archaeon]
MVNVYKCEICEEGYIGDEKPTHCPFCGAHIEYIVLVKDYVKTELLELSDITRKNILAAIDLEAGNAEFYFCAAKNADNVSDATTFKRLAKIESEHASTLAKLIPDEKGSEILRDKDTCHIKNVGNLKESYERETNAIKHYSQFLAETEEPRVIEVFEAIIDIEKDHLTLTEGRF